MDNNSATTSSLGFLTDSSWNGEPIRLCDVVGDAESTASEHSQVDNVLVTCGDDDGYVSGIKVEYS